MSTSPTAGTAEWTGSWRVAARVARRAAWRNKARSLLVLLMLALPVFAGSMLILTWAAAYASPDREASWRLGQADMWFDGSGVEQVAASLPMGSTTHRHLTGDTIVVKDGVKAIHEYWGADVTHPVNAGKYVVRAGRPPRGGSEVALTSGLASSLGLDVGATISAGLPSRTLTVTGIVDTADQLSRQVLIVPTDHPLSQDPHSFLVVDLPPGSAWTPDDLRINGLGALQRADVQPTLAQQAARTAGLTLVIGFAGVQVGLLAATAFAIGARRQQRELAMVGAVGATKRQVARVVLANGVVLGAAAGVLGLTAGLLTFLASRNLVERIVNHPLKDDGLPLLPLAGVTLSAIAVGVLAALGPALTISRLPIRAAMAGRETTAAKTGARLLGMSATMAACGVGIAFYAARPTVGSITLATAGAGLVLIGTAGCAPALIGMIGRLAAATPLPMRLAIRHAGRHQLRIGAAVAAVCAAMAGSLAVTLFYSADTRTGITLQPNARTGQVLLGAEAAAALPAADLSAVQKLLPVRSVIELQTVPADAAYLGPISIDQAPPNLPQTVTVGGADLIRAVTGRDPDPAVLDVLARGDAVIFYSVFQTSGHVRLRTEDGREIEMAAVLAPAPDHYKDLPSVVIAEHTAIKHDLPIRPGGLIFDTIRPPTAQELAAAQDAVLTAQLRHSTSSAISPIRFTIGAKPGSDQQTDPMVYVLATVSILVTIVASVVAVGLATSEMRSDLATLAAVGAGPRLRRWLTASQAGLIVGLGAVLGLLAGITPAAGLVALRPDLAWHMPWGPVLLVTIGTPLLVVVTTAVFTRSRLVLTRRYS